MFESGNVHKIFQGIWETFWASMLYVKFQGYLGPEWNLVLQELGLKLQPKHRVTYIWLQVMVDVGIAL